MSYCFLDFLRVSWEGSGVTNGGWATPSTSIFENEVLDYCSITKIIYQHLLAQMEAAWFPIRKVSRIRTLHMEKTM